jgi:hypothetical protein
MKVLFRYTADHETKLHFAVLIFTDSQVISRYDVKIIVVCRIAPQKYCLVSFRSIVSSYTEWPLNLSTTI